LNRSLNLLLIIVANLFLFSCKELTGENTGANIIDSGQELIGGLDAINAGENKFLLKGTTDNGGNSGHSFRLRFKLPEAEKLSFYFFISKNFSGGASYSFTRVEGTVKLTMSLNGKSHTRELTTFNDSEIIDVDLDVHNDHTDVHLLVWDRSGPHEDTEECSFDGGCLYNSEDFAFDIWLGVGRASGTFWGFQGKKSLVIILEGPLPAISDA